MAVANIQLVGIGQAVEEHQAVPARAVQACGAATET
jgi:hypothetical protein